MTIPNWYELLLLGLAAWRTYRLIAFDVILDGPRAWLLRRSHLADFLACPFCLGFWVALAWWGAWEAAPHALTIAASAVAVTAIVPLIELLTSDD